MEKFDFDTWGVIEEYFKKNKILINHQLSSFNYFIDNQLLDITKQYNPIKLQFQNQKRKKMKKRMILVILCMCFDNTRLGKPQIHENNGTTKCMTPHIARLRNLTYSSPVYIDVVITTVEYNKKTKKTKKHTKVINKVAFGKLPIMLRSKCCILNTNLVNNEECSNDLGGYFIINGSEKVIVSQEHTAENRVLIFPVKSGGKYKAMAEIKSISGTKYGIVRTFQIKLTTASAQKEAQ